MKEKLGRRESKKSMLNLFRGKKSVISEECYQENGDNDVLSTSGKSTSQEDLPDGGRKEAKKSKLSLFRGKKSVSD